MARQTYNLYRDQDGEVFVQVTPTKVAPISQFVAGHNIVPTSFLNKSHVGAYTMSQLMFIESNGLDALDKVLA